MDPVFAIVIDIVLVFLLIVVVFWSWFKRRMKWIVRWLGIFFVFLVLSFCYLVNDLFSYHWPKIADSAKVRHEATVLWQMANLPRFGPPWNPLEAYDRTVIPKQDWPEGIADLHPKQVVVMKDHVKVVTDWTGRGGNRAWGYRIYTDGVQRRDGGIEKWQIEDEQR